MNKEDDMLSIVYRSTPIVPSVARQKPVYFICHSGLDPESSFFTWIPAFAGMTA
ncbi:MAG TPA: hypothetical protein VK568_10800 [Thermodesulfobacteriota bacterium]|jgi:hypothetical protein|nr:hypothetical protein [Thermodesulfobacteriota bacterium]